MSTPATIEEFHYRLPGPTAGLRPGYHRSPQAGDGMEIRTHVPFGSGTDARRLDLRASLRDPFERLLVRSYAQRSSIPVYALIDLSASMGAGTSGDHGENHGGDRGNGTANAKMRRVADFVASLGLSVYRTSDAFGCFGCADRPLPEFSQPLTRARGTGSGIAERLREHVPAGRNAQGLVEAATGLPGKSGLVFVLSDFHLPLALVDDVLGALGRHLTVPVVLGESEQSEDLPAFGIARVVDAESGAERTVLMRPRLRERMREQAEARRKRLDDVMTHRGCRPLDMSGSFRAEDVTRYFFG